MTENSNSKHQWMSNPGQLFSQLITMFMKDGTTTNGMIKLHIQNIKLIDSSEQVQIHARLERSNLQV